MPRQARIDNQGAFNFIMTGGMGLNQTFKDDDMGLIQSGVCKSVPCGKGLVEEGKFKRIE